MLVPPDVSSGDLPVPPASGYSYIPAEAANDPTGWHKIVPTANAPSIPAVIPISERSAPFLHESIPPAPQVELEPEPEPEPEHSHDPEPVRDVVPEQPQASIMVPKADVSRTIFGGHFRVVPVKSRVNPVADKPVAVGETDIVGSTTEVQQVTLQLDSTGKVNVMDDYGLKGGHTSVVYDAVFLPGGKSLVTCGADGKICIWNMSEHVVEREFIPYDGEAVTMVYALSDEEDSSSTTLMTLSSSRCLRIWIVDDTQAILLRDSKVQESEGDLFMSVPRISKELKARAIAATTAAAITTCDAPEESILTGTAELDGERGESVVSGALEADVGPTGQDSVGQVEYAENVEKGTGLSPLPVEETPMSEVSTLAGTSSLAGVTGTAQGGASGVPEMASVGTVGGTGSMVQGDESKDENEKDENERFRRFLPKMSLKRLSSKKLVAS